MSQSDRAIKKLATQLARLDREVKSWRGAQLDYTSVENGGRVVFNNNDGSAASIVGGQTDGGNTVNVLTGPTPPTPTNFTVTVDHGYLTVHWDGDFEDGALAPTDWARWTAYAQAGQFVVPDRTTSIGGTDSASGGEVTAGVLKGEWTVTLLAWSQAGKPSAMATPVTVEVPGYGEIVLTEIDAAETVIRNAGEVLVTEQGTLGEKLAESDAALAGLESTVTNLDQTTLPALRSDLDAAEGRLTEAENDLAAVPGAIAGAEQSAKDAAQAWDTALSTSINDTIDTARTELEGDISAAQSTATSALTAANTKNKVTRSTSRPPASYDGRVDDVWFTMSSMGSGGRVLFQEMWNGTTWVSVTIDSQVIAYLDAAKITTGYLDVAALIRAGAITADKILVGAGRNLIPWAQVLSSSTTAPHSGFDATDTFVVAPSDSVAGVPIHAVHNRTTNDPGLYRNMITFRPAPDTGGLSGRFAVSGGTWAFVCRAYTSVTSLYGRLAITLYDGSGAYITRVQGASTLVGSLPTDLSVTVAFPANAAYAIPTAMTNQPGVTHWVSPQLAPAVGTTLIEPGAVTTDRLAANVLEVGNLKAGTAAIAEAVVQKIAASTASIQQADVKNLFVTGTSSLSDVVAERIAAETAEFIELEVGNLVAGTGTMDSLTVQKLFSDVVVASMAMADEFIGENAILTGAVTAPKITASEELWAKIAQFVKVRAEHIESDAIDGMVITGPTIQSAREGQRWVGDAQGIRIFNADDEVRTKLSPDDSVFKGEVEADTLVVNGGSELRSMENKLGQGAKLTLESGVTDPTAPPTVQPFWDVLGFERTWPVTELAGLAFDGTNYWTAKATGAWIEGERNGLRAVRIAPSGETSLFVLDPGGGGFSEVYGVTCIGSELFWLYRSVYSHKVLVTDLNCVRLREFPYAEAGHSSSNPLVYKPGIGTDGTNIFIAHCSDAGSLTWRSYDPVTGAKVTELNANNTAASDVTGVYVGAADWGGRWVAATLSRTNRVDVYSTSGLWDGTKAFQQAEPGSVGLVFSGGKFRTLHQSGSIHEYAADNMGDGTNEWWGTYRWSTDVDDDGVNDYTSRIGPVKQFTWPRRSKVRFMGAPLPVGVEYITPSIAKKATTPTLADFRTPNFSAYVGESNAWYSSLPSDWQSGPAPGDTNDFPDAEPSTLVSASATFQVNGDGSGHWGPLTFNADGTMTSSQIPAWVPLTGFLNGWGPYAGRGYAPAYRVWPDGKVEWRGMLTTSTPPTTGQVVFTIPAVAKPAQDVSRLVAGDVTSGRTGAQLDFRAAQGNAAIWPTGTGNVPWFSLDGFDYYLT